MKTTSPTRRAVPYARAGFHHGSLTGGLTLARRPDILTLVIISFCYGLK